MWLQDLLSNIPAAPGSLEHPQLSLAPSQCQEQRGEQLLLMQCFILHGKQTLAPNPASAKGFVLLA